MAPGVLCIFSVSGYKLLKTSTALSLPAFLMIPDEEAETPPASAVSKSQIPLLPISHTLPHPMPSWWALEVPTTPQIHTLLTPQHEARFCFSLMAALVRWWIL